MVIFQLNVIPELLDPIEGSYTTSLTNGLAIDILEVDPGLFVKKIKFFIQMASTRGISMEKLVTFLHQFVLQGGAAGEGEGAVGERDICKKEVAAVVARLARVRVQAARFRTR